MITCKEIRIHLNHEKNSDGYNTAIIACFGSSDKDATCIKAWCIDSYDINGTVSGDFERDDIRIWPSNPYDNLVVSEGYSPIIRTK